MRKKYSYILLIVLSLIICGNLSAEKNTKKKKREIAFTFNELPISKSFQDIDRKKITDLYLDTFDKYEVKAVGFVVGERIEDSFDLLGEWLNRGHKLGNMTYSNQDYHQVGIEQFITDISKGDGALQMMLNGFGQKERYFRFPFLHYGDEIKKKEQSLLFLEAHDYTVVHATVVVDDFLYNLSYEKMGHDPDSVEFENLLNEYINHVLDKIEEVEALALRMLGRPCKLILALNANQLNAVYLDEMMGALKAMDFTFITVDQALKDKVYRQEEAYFGSRGVGYLEMIQNSDPDFLPAK